MGFFILGAEAFQKRQVKLVLLAATGALAGNDVPQTCDLKDAFPLFCHAVERAPGSIIRHWLVDTIEAILQA